MEYKKKTKEKNAPGIDFLGCIRKICQNLLSHRPLEAPPSLPFNLSKHVGDWLRGRKESRWAIAPRVAVIPYFICSLIWVLLCHSPAKTGVGVFFLESRLGARPRRFTTQVGKPRTSDRSKVGVLAFPPPPNVWNQTLREHPSFSGGAELSLVPS